MEKLLVHLLLCIGYLLHLLWAQSLNTITLSTPSVHALARAARQSRPVREASIFEQNRQLLSTEAATDWKTLSEVLPSYLSLFVQEHLFAISNFITQSKHNLFLIFHRSEDKEKQWTSTTQ